MSDCKPCSLSISLTRTISINTSCMIEIKIYFWGYWYILQVFTDSVCTFLGCWSTTVLVLVELMGREITTTTPPPKKIIIECYQENKQGTQIEIKDKISTFFIEYSWKFWGNGIYAEVYMQEKLALQRLRVRIFCAEESMCQFPEK